MVCLLLALNGLFHVIGFSTLISCVIMLADSYIGLYLFSTENKIDLANYINIDIAYFHKKLNVSRPSLRVTDEEFTNDNDYNKV